jgi:hypothetical protein
MHVPRPQRPQRTHHESFDDDDWMADRANLDVGDYRALIKKPAVRLIDDFVASWQRRPTRGRRPEDKRNALINALAKLFHEQSGWQLRYKSDSDIYDREYRTSLRAFLVLILVANDIDYPDDQLVRLRVIEPAYRIPRA